MLNIRSQGVRSFLIILLCQGLGACSTGLFRYFEIAPASYSVLDYYQWAGSAEQNELDAEIRRLQPLAETAQEAVAAVQLALVYTVPALANAENERAAITLLASLESLSGRGRAGDYLEFARIWREVLEQKLQLRELQQTRTELQQQMLEADELNRSLQNQIDALTTIEQQLIEREQLQEQP